MSFLWCDICKEGTGVSKYKEQRNSRKKEPENHGSKPGHVSTILVDRVLGHGRRHGGIHEPRESVALQKSPLTQPIQYLAEEQLFQCLAA